VEDNSTIKFKVSFNEYQADEIIAYKMVLEQNSSKNFNALYLMNTKVSMECHDFGRSPMSP
jgi:hypothetical protein